ncbi:beta-galactosidase GalA [Puia dinghuensis]|uniref:Beta-galactosidase n=1 Tax=Puia dinghuensis TaxID=1792502 RepID=A0A8J2XSJ5_9BACT|nr:beta-galactosidase GalA [Puia dinghuensis]GGA95576.1 beta-galactosidase [Puia dinghuensis]
MKQLFFLMGMLVVSAGVLAQERQRISFDEGWKFHLGDATDPHRDFNYTIGNILAKTGDAANTCIKMDFDDRDWTPVSLPHDWAVGLPFNHVHNGDVDAHGYHAVGALFPENSAGWYRKAFMVDRKDSGKRFVIQFDGIFRDSKVWVNNCYMGGHFSGYSGAAYDITDFLRYGGKNVIVVRVDASQYEGWFYEGAGIYRHTWLNEFDNTHFALNGGVYVHTASKGEDAEVTIETNIEGSGAETVSASILDRKGEMVAKGDGGATIALTVKKPVLWSLENPYLYRAVVLLHSGGRVIDSQTVRFGIRTVTVDKDKGLFLNGVPVKIQGVCCHQDHAGVGSALPDYLQYYRIGLLKEMGCNAYRTSHNAPTPELLDACDSLGMLVLDETRLLNSGAEYGADFEQQILRDRNHPSVFMWSIGNEEWVIQYSVTGKLIAQHQIDRQRRLDPSRTCTYAANVGNVWHGVNEVIPVRGFNYNLGGLDAYRKEHPDQPIMGTEVASTVSTRGIYIKDTVNAYVPDYDSVAPPWASTAEFWWRIAAERPWFMGGFAWTGFDYRGEPTPFQWPDINSHFGIMDMCGFPKTVYYYYQSWWTDKDMVHIAPNWNRTGKEEGKPVAVWVNTNAENVELFLNGKSLGKKEMPRNGHLEWMVPYTPGKLEAVAYKKGRKITAVEETTGEAYRIVVSSSSGGGVTVYNCAVVDKQGKEVPDAQNLLHFSVSGGARIIGVGNGDPSSHEADQYPEGGWQRHLFNGKCQVIVQSTGAAGPVVFTVTGEGLVAAQMKAGGGQ